MIKQETLTLRDKCLRAFTRVLIKPILNPAIGINKQRRLLNVASASLSWPQPKGIQQSRIKLGEVNCILLEPSKKASVDEPVLLYFHGGAYCLGSPAMPVGMLAQIVRSIGIRIYIVDYRLAPEHPFPAALDDALTCYQALLAQGVKSSQIILSGDSAGGGLSLGCLLSLKQQHAALPGALVLFSPWCDLGLPYRRKVSDKKDNILSWAWLEHCAALYRGKLNQGDSPAKDDESTTMLTSPLQADQASLQGLPPILIQAGSEEIFVHEAKDMYQALKQAESPVQLEIYQGGWHAFQLNVRFSPLAEKAINNVSEFITNL